MEISEDTVYQVASISKAVTAIGVMRLAEEGQVNLNDSIDNYITRWRIPGSTFNSKEVTIKGLLSHTAGLSVGGGYPGYEPNSVLPSLEDSLSGLGGGSRPVELVREPGDMYSYSGGGYNLLQLLIEEVTGADFENYMEKEVLTPLGMLNSSFTWTEQIKSDTATAYDDRLNVLPNYLFIEKAAAGLYTTVNDMNSFVIGQLNSYNNSGILRAESIKEAHAPVLEVQGLDGFIYENTALGHFVNIGEDRSPIIAHDGSNNGWKANFSMIPDKGAGIVILTNGNNGTYLLNDVLDAWYYSIYGSPRTFDKLQKFGKGLIYSISSLLGLWSILSLANFVIANKNGTRKVLSFNAKWRIIVRSILMIIMYLLVRIVKNSVVPILGFLSPSLGYVLLIAIALRVGIGMVELLFPKIHAKKEIEARF